MKQIFYMARSGGFGLEQFSFLNICSSYYNFYFKRTLDAHIVLSDKTVYPNKDELFARQFYRKL